MVNKKIYILLLFLGLFSSMFGQHKLYFELSLNQYTHTDIGIFKLPVRQSQRIEPLNHTKINTNLPFSQIGIGKVFNKKFIRSAGIFYSNFGIETAGFYYGNGTNKNLFRMSMNINEVGIKIKMLESKKNTKIKFNVSFLFHHYIALDNSKRNADTISSGVYLNTQKQIEIERLYPSIFNLFPIIETGISIPIVKIKHQLLYLTFNINLFTNSNLYIKVADNKNGSIIKTAPLIKSLNWGLRYEI